METKKRWPKSLIPKNFYSRSPRHLDPSHAFFKRGFVTPPKHRRSYARDAVDNVHSESELTFSKFGGGASESGDNYDWDTGPVSLPELSITKRMSESPVRPDRSSSPSRMAFPTSSGKFSKLDHSNATLKKNDSFSVAYTSVDETVSVCFDNPEEEEKLEPRIEISKTTSGDRKPLSEVNSRSSSKYIMNEALNLKSRGSESSSPARTSEKAPLCRSQTVALTRQKSVSDAMTTTASQKRSKFVRAVSLSNMSSCSTQKKEKQGGKSHRENCRFCTVHPEDKVFIYQARGASSKKWKLPSATSPTNNRKMDTTTHKSQSRSLLRSVFRRKNAKTMSEMDSETLKGDEEAEAHRDFKPFSRSFSFQGLGSVEERKRHIEYEDLIPESLNSLSDEEKMEKEVGEESPISQRRELYRYEEEEEKELNEGNQEDKFYEERKLSQGDKFSREDKLDEEDKFSQEDRFSEVDDIFDQENIEEDTFSEEGKINEDYSFCESDNFDQVEENESGEEFITRTDQLNSPQVTTKPLAPKIQHGHSLMGNVPNLRSKYEFQFQPFSDDNLNRNFQSLPNFQEGFESESSTNLDRVASCSRNFAKFIFNRRKRAGRNTFESDVDASWNSLGVIEQMKIRLENDISNFKRETEASNGGQSSVVSTNSVSLTRNSRCDSLMPDSSSAVECLVCPKIVTSMFEGDPVDATLIDAIEEIGTDVCLHFEDTDFFLASQISEVSSEEGFSRATFEDSGRPSKPFVTILFDRYNKPLKKFDGSNILIETDPV